MWQKLYFNETIEAAIDKVIKDGLAYVHHDTGLITPNMGAMSARANWLFSGYQTMGRDCYLWHSIMFTYFGLVPKYCLERCYKVVVKVRNFRETILFHRLMNAASAHNNEIAPIAGKSGMDERTYTEEPWNAFIYADGLEDALSKYHHARKLVDECMEDGRNIRIIIKRSCTEFERAYGPTDQPFWEGITKENLDFQRHLEDIFSGQWGSAVQPDWLKNKLTFRFIKWANTIGDKSWLDLYPEDFLTMKAVTYHPQEDLENGTGKNQNDGGA